MDVERWTLDVCCESLISPRNTLAFRRALLAWFDHHGRDLPWRNTRDPYAILVSEIMLQQTQVATVVPYYNRWLQRFPDFAALAAAQENDVLHAWQGLGYYRRARNLHAAAKKVQDRHDGIFPREASAVRELPGVGRYTANAVATFAFDQAVPIVEANTGRLLARLFNIRIPVDSGPGQKALWDSASSLIPPNNAGRFNSALMDLGATVCVSRNPKCGICPVKKFCCTKNPESLPIKKPRPATKQLIEEHVFVVRQQKILLKQAQTRWVNMWILPPLSVDRLNRSRLLKPEYVSVFPFTNHRITLRVFGQQPRTVDRQRSHWFAVSAIDRIPIPSPHRRAIEALLH